MYGWQTRLAIYINHYIPIGSMALLYMVTFTINILQMLYTIHGSYGIWIIYRVLYGCVCPWRLALQKEGWRQQMDEIRAVRTVEQLLFALSWSQKWGQKPDPKTGPQYCRKKERLPKWRPRFWDQGVAYTVSPPLRAVSSGNSGTFRLFSWQWAWQSLIQVSQYIYIYGLNYLVVNYPGIV